MALWKDVIQLQHQRCEIYANWDSTFKRVLEGSLSSDDYSSLLTQTIVVSFQENSRRFRDIRDSPSTSAVVSQWTAKLQQLEKAKYDATVEFQKMIIEHISHGSTATSRVTAENSCAASPASLVVGGCAQHCRDCPLSALLLFPPAAKQERMRITFELDYMDEHDEGAEDEQGEDADDTNDAVVMCTPIAEAERVRCVRSCQEFNAKLCLCRSTLMRMQGSVRELVHEAQEEVSDAA